MLYSRVRVLGRVIFALLWVFALAGHANARGFIETNFLAEKPVLGTAGSNADVLAVLNKHSTGHHPKITANYLLPELKVGLFPSFKLSRQTGCMAIAIYYEARGERFSGQVAVGQVILNRVTSRKYPNNICDVVYQNAHKRNRCQFSFTCDGKLENPRNKKSWDKAMMLAKVLTGKTKLAVYAKTFFLTSILDQDLLRSTHYHATYVNPGWSRRLERSGKIGQHIFYISKRVWS